MTRHCGRPIETRSHWFLEVQEKLEGEATPIPRSHFTDRWNASEVDGEQVVGARWVCTSCHVAQTGAQPLVGNRLGA